MLALILFIFSAAAARAAAGAAQWSNVGGSPQHASRSAALGPSAAQARQQGTVSIDSASTAPAHLAPLLAIAATSELYALAPGALHQLDAASLLPAWRAPLAPLPGAPPLAPWAVLCEGGEAAPWVGPVLPAGAPLKALAARLAEEGVFVDTREPSVMRVAPAPLYNCARDVADFVDALAAVMAE